MSDVNKILVVGKTLLNKYELEAEKLDELQKAQIVQTLVRAKLQLGEEIKTYPPDKEKAKEILAFFKSVDVAAEEVNLTDVKDALERLSLGVAEMIKEKEDGKG